MTVVFKNDWQELLANEFNTDSYQKLRQKLISEYNNFTVYPDKYDIFNALHHTAYQDVKVVILGQDPYHNPGQAHGLSFSVKPGIVAPPSLVNIFNEIKTDLGGTVPNNGCLVKWADQGVLLLNTVLTVRAGEANSHKDIGWTRVTDNIISLLNKRETPIVFILWGKNAQEKKPLISNSRHLVLQSVHPSPLSSYRGFLVVNLFLRQTIFW